MAYGKLCLSRSSPHDAVFATFDIPVRNRYLSKRSATAARCLKILVADLSCRNLVSSDPNGFSDPMIQILCPVATRIVTTAPKPKTLNPTWYDVLEVNVDLAEPQLVNTLYLTFVVLDADLTGAAEPLGEAVLPLETVDPSGMSESPLSAPVVKNGMLCGVLTAKVRFVVMS